MKSVATNDIEMLNKVAEASLVEHTLKALKENSVQMNSSRVVTCQVKELLKAESYIVPKSLKIGTQSTKIRRLPLSTNLIHRNLVTAKS